MPALIRADRDPLHVLGDRRVHDLPHGPVMSEMNHLGPLGLKDSAHDVDGRVMAIEQRSGGNEPHWMNRDMQLGHACLHTESL
ncbi:hypothetical protein GCM10010198_37020 [Nocardia seriolae]|nr:hypothetical protein NS2_01520 [Nocardia seriolae NBRC 15557]